MDTPDARQLIEQLGLAPLPREGGWYRETYRSRATCPTPCGERSLATAIYYLLTPDTFSAWHRLPGDELYHAYAGDPVELFTIDSAGSLQRTLLGTRVNRGEPPQHLVPGGCWQASRLVAGGVWHSSAPRCPPASTSPTTSMENAPTCSRTTQATHR